MLYFLNSVLIRSSRWKQWLHSA